MIQLLREWHMKQSVGRSSVGKGWVEIITILVSRLAGQRVAVGMQNISGSSGHVQVMNHCKNKMKKRDGEERSFHIHFSSSSPSLMRLCVQLGLCSINSTCSSQQPFLSSDSLAFSTLRKRLGEVEEQAHIELLGLGSQYSQGRTMGGTENSKSYCQSELTFIANNLDVIRPDRGMSMWIIFSVIPYS